MNGLAKREKVVVYVFLDIKTTNDYLGSKFVLHPKEANRGLPQESPLSQMPQNLYCDFLKNLIEG